MTTNKLFFFLFCFLVTCFELPSSTFKNDPKTLILIIATDDKPAYRELQKVWETYMNSDIEHFEVYFIRCDENLSQPWVIKKNEIVVKTKDSFVPGILNKTLLSMEAMLPRLDEFDFVIRSNLSSFYCFSNLLKGLKSLPREKCCAGITMCLPDSKLTPGMPLTVFTSGASIIYSSDVVKKLVKESRDLESYKEKVPDDVFLGIFCMNKGISQILLEMWEFPTYAAWQEGKDKIPNHAYHFRAKSAYGIRQAEDPYADELATLKELVQKYYPNECPRFAQN